MKNLKNLKGAKMLSKNEQKVILGGVGIPKCSPLIDCPLDMCCTTGWICVYPDQGYPCI